MFWYCYVTILCLSHGVPRAGQAGISEDAFGRAGDAAAEAVHALRTVHSYNLQARCGMRYAALVAAPVARMCRAGLTAGAIFGASQCVMFSFFALAFWCAATCQARCAMPELCLATKSLPVQLKLVALCLWYAGRSSHTCMHAYVQRSVSCAAVPPAGRRHMIVPSHRDRHSTLVRAVVCTHGSRDKPFSGYMVLSAAAAGTACRFGAPRSSVG